MNEALLDRQPRETQFGHHNGIALLNKVVEYGDAPEGDFRNLLDEPWGEHLGEDWDEAPPSRFSTYLISSAAVQTSMLRRRA